MVYFYFNKRNMMKKNLLFLIILCFSLFLNPVYARRVSARDKACFSNQRVIQGAIEMYNMDHSVMISSIEDVGTDEGGHLEPTPNLNGYLKSVNYPESQCRYRYNSDENKEMVYCVYHGSVGFSYEAYRNNKLDPSIIPPAQEYLDELERKRREKEFQNMMNYLIPIGVFIMIGTIIWALSGSPKKKRT